jgi:hypothetical protein
MAANAARQQGSECRGVRDKQRARESDIRPLDGV